MPVLLERRRARGTAAMSRGALSTDSGRLASTCPAPGLLAASLSARCYLLLLTGHSTSASRPMACGAGSRVQLKIERLRVRTLPGPPRLGKRLRGMRIMRLLEAFRAQSLGWREDCKG